MRHELLIYSFLFRHTQKLHFTVGKDADSVFVRKSNETVVGSGEPSMRTMLT